MGTSRANEVDTLPKMPFSSYNTREEKTGNGSETQGESRNAGPQLSFTTLCDA
jgi:hypothetical protein